MQRFLRKYYEFERKRRSYIKKIPHLKSFLSLGWILLWVFAFKSSILDANNIPSGSMIPTLKIGDFLFVNKMRYTLRIPFTHIVLWEFDEPKRGDIITFKPPPRPNLEGKTLVKRVVGVPGDTIEVIDNEVYVNGIKYPVFPAKDRKILEDVDYPPCFSLPCERSIEDFALYKERIMDPKTKKLIVEHYILKQKGEVFSPLRNPGVRWKVPEGKYFVMGDNRDDSEDSREWGFVDKKDIEGKVYMIYFSVNWGDRYDPFRPLEFLSSLFYTITHRIWRAKIRWERIGSRIY